MSKKSGIVVGGMGDGHGIKVQPGHGHSSRGIEDTLHAKDGRIADYPQPPVSTRHVASHTKSFHYHGSHGDTSGLNGEPLPAQTGVVGLERDEQTRDSPVPTAGRQLPHPDIMTKAQEAASADKSIGDVPHPAGVLGRR